MTFDELLYGGYASVYLPNTDSKPLTTKQIINLLTFANEANVQINPDELSKLNNKQAKLLTTKLEALQSQFLKKGFIFRKSFNSTKEIPDYTHEDYMAIYAQYSITYGWSSFFNKVFGNSANSILSSYFQDSDADVINQITSSEPKQINVLDSNQLIDLVSNILESTRSLNKHEIKLVNAVDYSIFVQALADSRITFNETKNLVISRLVKQKDITKLAPMLSNPTDVVRLVLSDYATPAITGKFIVSDLKDVKLRIPTSVRKTLVRALDRKAHYQQNSDAFAEDMLKYKNFWKRLDKFLYYGSVKKRNRQNPNYAAAISRIYDNDTSWTFNSRYEVAKSKLDYKQAFEVAMERPGFLMRNILEFLRMTEGTPIPVKAANYTSYIRNMEGQSPRTIKHDASELIKSDQFYNEVLMKTNIKLLWELVVQLADDTNYEPTTERLVQGKYVEYLASAPYPELNKKLAKHLKTKVISAIKLRKRADNESLGKVYFSDDVKNYIVPFSDRANTSISMSGEILTSGSKISLKDYKYLRVGVMWKGKQSADLDLSTLFTTGAPYSKELSWRQPVLRANDRTLAASSGDITSCSDNKFSTELIDIDLDKVKEHYTGIFNNVVNYSGPNMDNLETYFFIQRIDSIRAKKATRFYDVELDKVDYAIKIEEPNTRSHAGFYFDLEKDQAIVLNKNLQGSHSLGISYIKNMINELQTTNSELTLKNMLKKSIHKSQLVDNPEEADLIISTIEGLHPARDISKLQKIVF